MSASLLPALALYLSLTTSSEGVPVGPVPWAGVSSEGRSRLADVLCTAQSCTPADLAVGADGSIRAHLRIIAALLPDRQLVIRMHALLANDCLTLEDAALLLADRQHEVPIVQLRVLVGALRAGATIPKAAAAAGCSPRTAASCAAFLGSSDAAAAVAADAAWDWAWEQLSFERWSADSGLDPAEALREYEIVLRRNGPLTVPQKALFAADVFARAFADALQVSRSVAYRLLSDGRAAVAAVEGFGARRA